MNPLLINTYDRGGAAKACIRLHKGLLMQNIPSKLLVRNKSRNDIPEVYNVSLQTIERSFKTKITDKTINILKEIKLYKPKPDNFVSKRPKGLEIFSYPFSDYNIKKSKLYKEADIINLHWVAGFLDYKSFFKNNNKPVVWTLHDQNPFTGGEHYTEQYWGIDEKGYPIKRTFTKTEQKKFEEILKIKKDALSDFDNLHIVALCNWMANEVKQSEVFRKFPVNIIPNGVDLTVFKPRDKAYCRELLNIPQNKKVVLFVADSLVNKRKGFEFLHRSVNQIKRNDLFLLSVGSKGSSLIKSSSFKELGYIYDELLMSIIYSAADVFVIPSLMDNLPNTVLESIMCGTPVIGFPVGGILDMIKHGDNGLLTDEISVPALTKTINDFLDNVHLFDNTKIRSDAEKKYNLNIQAKSYINLYQTILNKQKH